MSLFKLLCIGLLVFSIQGCGGSVENQPPVITVGPKDDGSIVRGVVAVNVVSEQSNVFVNLFNKLFPNAYASNGSTVVTYVNAPSVTFTIDVTGFAASGFTGNTLNLGNVSLASLDDNNLKVCGAGGNTKCTHAIIRVYTTGSIAGFVNTEDSYGVSVYSGTLNPTTALGLTSSGAVQVQNISIATNKQRLKLSDFPLPTYHTTSDFSNAGAGNYSMTFVIEYALAI